MRTNPLISATVLRGMPDFVRVELGEKALLRASRVAQIDPELIEDQDCFIPHTAVLDFIQELARITGEADFGLKLAPYMSIAHYGCWGGFVLGADTLGGAIRRGIDAIGYHSTGDRLTLDRLGDRTRLSYVFALAGRVGYHHAASASAGVLLSACRLYLASDWRPDRLEINVPKPRLTAPFEDLFDCPVIFDAPAVAVVFDAAALTMPRVGHAPRSVITLEDVARARWGAAPRDLIGVIAEQARVQVLSGTVSIEAAARTLGTSVRSLQRELNRAGTDFRSMTSAARHRRALELLRWTDASITSISADLGYSALAHFARAFHKMAGRTPRAFRGSAAR